MENKKKLILSFAFLLVIILYFGVLDSFSTGFYSNIENYNEIILNKDYQDYNLTEKSYYFDFIPTSRHFIGFEIYLTHILNSKTGSLKLEIFENNDLIEVKIIPLSQFTEEDWYKLRLKKELRIHTNYSANLSIIDTKTKVLTPMGVSGSFSEKKSDIGELLIGSAYKKSVFKFQERALISMILIAFWLLYIRRFIYDEKSRFYLKELAIFTLLVSILSWNFVFNSFDNSNTSFDTFQSDSESLVTNSILFNDELKIENGFGLIENRNGTFIEYESQYGLQGKFYSILYDLTGRNLRILNFLTALVSATVFVSIVFLLVKKFDFLFASIFYLTFLLSPWIVNFARNLYWVEYTWFSPMLIGLGISIWIEHKRIKLTLLVFLFISILVKSLSGYEYISTIMLSTISFLIMDNIVFYNEKKRINKLYLKTLIYAGIISLFAFTFAMFIHAFLRGRSDIISGFLSILNNDILRRTYGADLNKFPYVYWDSFNASWWDVLKIYFNFKTQIITGMDGNLFGVLFIAPIIITIFDKAKKNIDLSTKIMYIIFFTSTLSWFVLAKAHSYIHQHMNYVLWYFGFIQISIYIIIKYCIKMFAKK